MVYCVKCKARMLPNPPLYEGDIPAWRCWACGSYHYLPPPVAMPDYKPERNEVLQEIGRRREEWGGSLP